MISAEVNRSSGTENTGARPAGLHTGPQRSRPAVVQIGNFIDYTATPANTQCASTVRPRKGHQRSRRCGWLGATACEGYARGRARGITGHRHTAVDRSCR
jgi:hypothetical protein